ncbi:YbaB/EbfC family nucleoid-associated protein [Symbioplanes lichenis]|uniref:YbaB/EbfC family nucleoid-associated protein n=1 Tax=Symbioplanes lichenis TaxID=1629072 RepID=UPI0027392637|nr:YbaB/EbfC family nucleoid-associated protein [Actinoplanes lichenis]
MAEPIDGSAILDPDQASAYLQRWKGRVDRLAANTQEMSARLGRLRATAGDGEGFVEVTVDSTGVLVDATFTERIQRYGPEVTARALMRAIRAARRKAGEEARAVVVETMGADSPAGQAITARLLAEGDAHDG